MSKIPTPRLAPQLSIEYPRNRAGVIKVAHDWYDSSLVAVNTAGIKALPAGEVVPPPSGETSLEINKTVDLSDATLFAIAMGSINHMFWSHNEAGEFVRYQNDGQVGALAMSSAFEKAWSNPDSPIQRALVDKIPLTVSAVTEVFGPIPDPEGRVEILNEILLSDKIWEFGEEALFISEEGKGFDVEFAARLADAFPAGYADGVLKKAQLATSAIWRSAVSRGYEGEPCSLTAFADYQIPNVLRALGILDYNDELAARIDRGELIEADSKEERAIRAASILAIEELAAAQGVGVADVDYWVWLKRKEPKTPFHLTLTTAY